MVGVDEVTVAVWSIDKNEMVRTIETDVINCQNGIWAKVGKHRVFVHEVVPSLELDIPEEIKYVWWNY